MKYLVIAGLLLSFAVHAEETAGQKVKDGINTGADKIDSGTRKVIAKGKAGAHRISERRKAKRSKKHQ